MYVEHLHDHALHAQWNPVLPAVWGAPYWGHITSTDLVHWQRLPPALAPDTEYDSDGCFSGSTTLVDGVPVMLYTGVLLPSPACSAPATLHVACMPVRGGMLPARAFGLSSAPVRSCLCTPVCSAETCFQTAGVSNFSELGYYKQVQAMARPADLSDPQLKLWIKYAANPVISQAPPLGSSAQFRDPTTAWKQVRMRESCINEAVNLMHATQTPCRRPVVPVLRYRRTAGRPLVHGSGRNAGLRGLRSAVLLARLPQLGRCGRLGHAGACRAHAWRMHRGAC